MGIMSPKRDGRNYLDMTPVAIHQHEINEDGFVNVLVPRFTNKLMVKYVLSKWKKPYMKANLDEFGSAVWLMIDSKNKVGNISEKLLEQFGERIQPVNDRLTFFLTHLYRNGFITFIELERKK